jgi:DNA gyrase subunit B
MYDEQNIPKLDSLAHIRLRPGMYIGGIDERALHHLVYETVDNAVDEYLAGRCDHIWITLRDDNEVVIRDNGTGIPVHMMEESQLSWLEIFMTKVGFINGKLYQDHFGRKPYSVSGGLHGVGCLLLMRFLPN